MVVPHHSSPSPRQMVPTASGGANPASGLRHLLIVMVAAVLLSLVILPILTGRREERIHERISQVVTARSTLAAVEIDLVEILAVSRAYLIGRDPRVLRKLAFLLDQREARAPQLARFARQLGPDVARRAAELHRREALWTSVPRAMVAGRIAPEALVETVLLGQERFEAVLEAAAGLQRALSELEERFRREIEQIQALERGLVVILSLAALGIVAVVLWLFGRLESLARQLHHHANEMTALLESTGEGIFGLDRRGRCTFLNRAGSELLGYRPEEALGRDMHDLVHHTRPDGSPYPERECPMHRAIDRGEGIRAENELLWRSDGTAFPVEFTAFPRMEHGRVAGAVISFMDITERRQAEDALREREERFRFLFDDNPSMYFIVDPAGTILSVNRFGAEYLGYTVDEMLGRPIHTFVHEADRGEVGRHLADCARSPGEICRWEFRKVRKDGSILWVREAARAVREADGGLAILIACDDVTETKRAEQERERLIESERESRAAAEAARSDAERRARDETALRQAAEVVTAAYGVETTIRQIAGGALTATDALGAFVERIDPAGMDLEVVAVAGERVPLMGERIAYRGSIAERVIEGARPALFSDYSRYAGAKLPSLVTACPRCAVLVLPLIEAGQAIGVLVLLRGPEQPRMRADEIGRAHTFAKLAALAFHKVHLLEESEARREEIERVMASRERLIRGFGHDLKNPLGAADGYLQLLEDGIMGGLEPKQQESVGRIRRSIRSALELIEALVDLARAEAGRLEIEREPVDVRAVVAGTAEEYRARAEEAGLTLDLGLPPDLPSIDSNASRIRQILGNLLSNAVKYTEHGSVTVSVGTRAGGKAPGSGRWIAVDVADTGRGISEDQQRLLFEEFHRIDPRSRKGVGLGLAISQTLARLLGGALTVESELGIGSTFTLWLPFRGQGEDALERPPSRAA